MTDNEQKKIFSRNLISLLESHELTQCEVAYAINVSPQTFNTWCQGIALPRMGKVQKLADYFGILKSDLLDDKRFSDEAAKLNAKILFDVDLQTHIKKLDLLCGEDKKSVYDMIDFLYSKTKK